MPAAAFKTRPQTTAAVASERRTSKRKRSSSAATAHKSSSSSGDTASQSRDEPQPDDLDARAYDSQQYWEQRYQLQLSERPVSEEEADVTSEWYYDWQTLQPLLSGIATLRSLPVLDLGCGLSSLFAELIADGFTGPLIAADSAPSVISEQTSRWACRAQQSGSGSGSAAVDVRFEHRDLFKFNAGWRSRHPAEQDRYGLVVDKATSDGMMCSDDNARGIRSMYEMVGWSLRPGGVFLLVSVQEPTGGWCAELLLPSLVQGDAQRHSWSVTVHSIADSTYYDGQHDGPNVYVCVKNGRERRPRAAKAAAEDDWTDLVSIVIKQH